MNNIAVRGMVKKPIVTKTLIFKILIFFVLGIAFTLALGKCLDGVFENQDRMFCRSAKVSGNEEYLSKCQCYYNGSPISCISNKEEGHES